MGYPIVNDWSDEDFIRHLEQHHSDGIALTFKKRRRLSTREVWETYHDYWLHRANPVAAHHEHESYLWTGWERSMALDRGWLQQTRCVCLQPPNHATDCPGKLGVLVLADRHGPSARDLLWDRLDITMDYLMNNRDKESPSRTVVEARGLAVGVTFALAAMISPAKPDEKAIKAEAMRRWKERNASK